MKLQILDDEILQLELSKFLKINWNPSKKVTYIPLYNYYIYLVYLV